MLPDFRSASVRLLSLATALPPHRLLQSDAAVMARQIFGGRLRDSDRVLQVFEGTGIRSRHTVQPAA